MIFKKNNRIKWTVILLIPLVAIATIVVLFEYKYSDKYYPGIMIAGESVEGKTYNEVVQEFNQKSDSLINNGLTLVFEKKNGKSELNIPATTSGLTPDILVEYFSIDDPQQTFSNAFSLGRNENLAQRLKEQFDLFYNYKNFDFPISIHKEAIQSLLARETKYFFTAGKPSQFIFSENDELATTPEEPSDNIDIEKIVDTVVQKLNNMNIRPIVFNIQQGIPHPTQEQLKTFLPLANEIYKSVNINLYYKNNNWKISGKKLVTWLTLNQNNEIIVDNKKLGAFLSTS
ncbi:MAG: peptidoglycan binding domain-containing protein, partial [Candidatus Staskawiczbacteria bacterium]|nr:peptidoglycan binding domain-containing protein [Candidatus Staskawiczbacteria bacterium]